MNVKKYFIKPLHSKKIKETVSQFFMNQTHTGFYEKPKILYILGK